VTVRVRFANLNSVTRSVTLDAPISATVILAELAEELVRALLADHPHEKTISLLAISVSHLEEHWDVELELPLGLTDEARRPGTKKGMARWAADHARRQDPRSLRMGCHRIRIGRAGHLSFRSRRVSQTRRKGHVIVTSTHRASKDACFCSTPGPQRQSFSVRTPQRNRHELGEMTVNKTWRKHLPQP